MERNNDVIRFNGDEQKEFNLPESVDIPIALETATAFQDAANKLRLQAEEASSQAEDSDSHVLIHTGYLRMRADRLSSLSTGIIEAAFKD
jgi:hypothetical protein